ncbi:hypothetical protein [Halosimplex sp. TS25]|uniref:hypothetical protein n=1 Tax=Halosimplex rarum TaxID=3396619 RepID=UPI0039EC76CA
MSKDDPEAREKYLTNTHDAYRLFYTVLLTIGLSLGFNSVLTEFRRLSVSNFGRELPTLLTFSVFLLVVLRFFLGGVRHLDTTYLETDFTKITESQVSSQRFRAVDISMLLFDAGIIIILGGLVTMPYRFFTVFAVLLLIDGLWGILISYQMGSLALHNDPATQTKWGINNGGHFGLFVLGLAFAQWPVLVVLGFSNSLVDLYWTFDSYFPPLVHEE